MDGIVNDLLFAAVMLFGIMTIIGVVGSLALHEERRGHR